MQIHSMWVISHLITITGIQFTQLSAWPTRLPVRAKLCTMTSYTRICLLCRGALNAWPPRRMCARKPKPQQCLDAVLRNAPNPWIYDLILIIHADILHRTTVSNHSLPNRLWAITSECITAAALCEAKMCLKRVLCDLPLGLIAKRQPIKAANKWMQKQGHANVDSLRHPATRRRCL